MDSSRSRLPVGYRVTEVFGCNTFSGRTAEERLPRDIHRQLRETIETGAKLTEEVANAVAHAMKEWAIAHGATHYCHWFQPMTGLTAEKHDSFLEFSDGVATERLSGRNLIQGEPDASSFPSGGLRTTFEARGYTGWDPSSPAFLMPGPAAPTLCIPTVFTTFHGDAMDKKTPLLRSLSRLDAAARRLLGVLGRPAHGRITATIGAEQEYFLIDRKLWRRRPDLVMAGRSLIGAPPAKGQQLEDHYFGSIRDRVLAFMQDIELELYKLGVPVKTRHNEVAPAQFETAPIFEEANIAADHNFVTMEVMRRVAVRHDLALLLHEKPFAGINGSGKHCNWSMADTQGANFLDPGESPRENLHFLVFLAAVLEGVHRRADFLRTAIATSGNDHRLGANEAPPAIMSVFLGDTLNRVLEAITSGTPVESLPAKIYDMGLSHLPGIIAHSTDRNRTSPFAFTGNKFEFRAVGASQPISTPVTYLNAAVAEALSGIAERIEAQLGRGQPLETAVLATLRDSFRSSKAIRFEGNNYSPEWVAEASTRGLPNRRHAPAALAVLATPAAVEFLGGQGILSRSEIDARYHSHIARFLHDLEIEVEVMSDLARTYVLPAALAYQHDVGRSLGVALEHLSAERLAPERKLLDEIAGGIGELLAGLHHLEETVAAARRRSEPAQIATAYAEDVRPAMARLRAVCDRLEAILPHDGWPLPRYREMLFD